MSNSSPWADALHLVLSELAPLPLANKGSGGVSGSSITPNLRTALLAWGCQAWLSRPTLVNSRYANLTVTGANSRAVRQVRSV